MKQHAVVGAGTAPAKVIREGLNDVLDEGDVVLLQWTGKPTEGQETVYDYVLDNEIPFVMYYEDGANPPKVFRESDEGTIQKSREPLGKALDDTTGSVLVLDEDDDEFLILVHDMKDPGSVMLNLTNGLAPIVIEDEDPEVTEAASRYEDDEEEDEDEDDTRFTKDELEVMAASAVKRYGERIGAKGTTKKAIIAELFPDDEEEEHNNGHKSRDGDKDEPDADEDEDEPTTPLGQTLPEEDELQQAMDRVIGAMGHFLNVVAGRTN